jgi:hypothetical protein
MDAMLEHVLLVQLQHAPLTRAELVRRTSATDHTVQAGTAVRGPQQAAAE